MTQLNYLGLLTNVNDSILSVDLGHGFIIEKWPVRKFIKAWEGIAKQPAPDIESKLYRDISLCNSIRENSNVYVVSKIFKESPFIPQIKLESDNLDEFMRRFKINSDFEDSQTRVIDDKIFKLRLFHSGAISLFWGCFYCIEQGNPSYDTLIEECFHHDYEPYYVNTIDVQEINRLLGLEAFNNLQKYIELAILNFSQSYTVSLNSLKYLQLMITIETLFNNGPQEIRYRISRACAVLLGETHSKSNEIFVKLKKIYDKRSELVHTGDSSRIQQVDVTHLRDLTRRSLKRFYEFNLQKKEFEEILFSAGFGCANEIFSNYKKIF